MIATQRSSWLINEFSLFLAQEMYIEQYEEYAHWCSIVKGLGTGPFLM